MTDEKYIAPTAEYSERHDDVDFSPRSAAPEKMGVGRYLATRLSTLKPPMDRVENPFSLLATLSTRQWLFFLVAFFGWTWVCVHYMCFTAASS